MDTTAPVALDVTQEATALVSQLMDELLPPSRRAEPDDLRRAEWRACEDAAALAWAQLQILARDLRTLTSAGAVHHSTDMETQP